MSIDPYGAHMKDIKDKLIVVIKSTTAFATNTWADYIKKVSRYPVCFVRLRRDTIRDIGPAETRHVSTFVLQVENRSSYDEAGLDLIIGYVGQIVDKLDADRKLGSTHILNCEITEVDYTLRNDQEAIFHYAHITLEIESLRNV